MKESQFLPGSVFFGLIFESRFSKGFFVVE
jgi:hypothetical protein